MHTGYRRIGAAAIMAAALGMGCTSTRVESIPVVQESFEPSSEVHASSPINADAFLDPARFRASMSATSTEIIGRPIAGVVNHHVLTSDLLTRFFRSIRVARPDLHRLIILSPDHFKRGSDAISISSADYGSGGRFIRHDATSTRALLVYGSPAETSLVEGEHGVGALIPFMAREMPNVEIVSIMIRADVDRDRARALGAALGVLIDDHTFVIVSSDMSHYLSEVDALGNDIDTERWLRDRDGAAMEVASDDFTDNGPSFVVLFSLFEALNVRPTFQRIDHAISSAYGGDPEYTTSYITGVWSQR